MVFGGSGVFWWVWQVLGGLGGLGGFGGVLGGGGISIFKQKGSIPAWDPVLSLGVGVGMHGVCHMEPPHKESAVKGGDSSASAPGRPPPCPHPGAVTVDLSGSDFSRASGNAATARGSSTITR